MYFTGICYKTLSRSIDDNKLPMVQYCRGRDFDGLFPAAPTPIPDPRTPRKEFKADTVMIHK
jgi:hypothetical protein